MSIPTGVEAQTGGNGGVVIIAADGAVSSASAPGQAGSHFTAITSVDPLTDFSASTGNIDLHTKAFTVAAGVTIYGRWTSVTLSAGKVIAYYG